MQKWNRLLVTNPYWQQGKRWYELRSPGDRKVIQLLVAAIFTGLVYFLVWEPVTTWSEVQKDDYLYQQEINTWLKSHLPEARELQQHQQLSSSRGELSSIVASVARQVPVTLGRVQPDRKGLSVWVEDVAYQKLLKWLVVLQTRHGVAVRQIRIDRLKDEGRVKAYVHFGG